VDPLAALALLSRLAIVVPPPWGPVIAAAGKVLPLIAAGRTALAAVNAADPALLPHLCAGAAAIGLTPRIAAKIVFAPHQLTAKERAAAEKAGFDRASASGG
jgi:hypothetical protein